MPISRYSAPVAALSDTPGFHALSLRPFSGMSRRKRRHRQPRDLFKPSNALTTVFVQPDFVWDAKENPKQKVC